MIIQVDKNPKGFYEALDLVTNRVVFTGKTTKEVFHKLQYTGPINYIFMDGVLYTR